MYELETLAAPELGRLVSGGVSTVIVPFGSIEHQGEHLAVGADAMLADVVGREIARRLGAVLAPTVRVGCVEQHRQLTGSLSLRAQTLTEVALELGESLARIGFKVIALVSTHGGNRPALDTAVAQLDASLVGAVACAPRGDVGPQPGTHAGEWLTSVMLALRPELVDVAGARPRPRRRGEPRRGAPRNRPPRALRREHRPVGASNRGAALARRRLYFSPRSPSVITAEV